MEIYSYLGSSGNRMEQTSLDAYFTIKIDLNRREAIVIDALKELGGAATSWEIMDHLGTLNPNRVRPRLSDLRRKGVIEKTGTIYNDKYCCTENIWRLKEW